MAKRKLIQIVRQAKQVEIDESDLITPTDAAKLIGADVSTITRRMDAGELPTYIENAKSLRPKRWTSKKALTQKAELHASKYESLFI